MSEWRRLSSGAVVFQHRGLGFTSHEPTVAERDRHQRIAAADGGREVTERPIDYSGAGTQPLTWPQIERR